MSTVQRLMRLARDGAEYRNWYGIALDDVMTLSYANEWEIGATAAALALFSPRVTVKRSVTYAVHYMRTGEILPTVMRGVRASVEHYERTGTLRGPKTDAFRRAILGDQDAVVLDTWMAKALRIDGKRFEAKRVRESAERRVVYVAHMMDWTPAETQAAIWSGTMMASGRSVPHLQLPIPAESFRHADRYPLHGRVSSRAG